MNDPEKIERLAAQNAASPSRGMTRRNVLRAAGVALALPYLESLAPRARGAEAARPPVRLGIFSVTGGTVLESWKLPEAGPLDKLPSILRPLDFAKQDLLVLAGLSQSGRADNTNGHEGCAFLHLTGAELARREAGRVWSSVSVDQAAAAVAGRETLLPSLEMGHTYQAYSFGANNAPLPSEANPRLVFERMFRGRRPVARQWREGQVSAPVALTAGPKDQQSVLDVVLEQAKDLRRGVGRTDQRKVDEYTESVRSVEKRMLLLEARLREERAALAGGARELPPPAHLPGEGTPIWDILTPVDNDPEKHAQYIGLLGDLMILAFQTDTTRVCTVAAGSDESMFPGVVTVGYERHCHTLEHQGNAGRPEDADPIARESLRQIHQWYTSLFADMIRKMKSIDEGGSSLLDNSMIMYTSYMADGGHGRTDYPCLLAGKAGGTLRTGRQIDFAGGAPMANLYVEMLERMGSPVKQFGESHTSPLAGKWNGRLPGLV